MKTDVHLKYFAEFLQWEMFQTKVIENQNTRFMFNNFFPKIVSFVG